MHNSDFDTHALLCDSVAANDFLPPHRRMTSGRTHSAPWEPSGYGAAITRHRPRLNGWDVLGWIGSAVLLGLTAWMVWG